MNRSEQFVHDLARAAFLSLWTYPNPVGKDSSKELCDVLVVCRPDIVIFSVKEIELKADGDREIQVERWRRRAVDESVKQIRGAERRLQKTSEVLIPGGASGVELGPQAQRVTHRVAVAIGSSGATPLESKDYGYGFVHVLDEEQLWLLLKHLDTITDFVEYLGGREQLVTNGTEGVLIGSEADLLAAYFFGKHSFDALKGREYDIRVIVGSWDDFAASAEYKAKRRADAASYVWDRLISQVHEDYALGRMDFGGDLASIDAITRIMAREPRLGRRVLGRMLHDFLQNEKVRSRIMLGDSGIAYVLLKQKHALPREDRAKELQLRCFIARDWLEEVGRPNIVVGIATEHPEVGSGFSLDLCLFDAPTWGADQREAARKMREDLDFFKNVQTRNAGEDEFPEG